jgi:2-methylcitrate dehydratase
MMRNLPPIDFAAENPGMNSANDNTCPPPDQVLTAIADYVIRDGETSPAYEAARNCLMDALGCALEALAYPPCRQLLGPVVPGTIVPNGARVPGTCFQLDPVQAAFNLGTMIRWLDFNDTWLAAEWGHPSDNLGGILSVADWSARTAASQGKRPLAMRDVLTAMIKAYEIQGCFALENSFNKLGMDHVVLVKVASVAVVTRLLGGSRDQIINALSQAWIDGHPLRIYRQAPNTGSRKSWAGGDATSRAVWLALVTLKGEMGYPGALTAKPWGVYDSLLRGKPFSFQIPIEQWGSYVMENVLFKVSFPAEFHSQTAAEGALSLYPVVRGRIGDIRKITVRTHRAAIRIIDKRGPLHNAADRDHCMQYIVAVALIFGRLTAADYEDIVAADPRIDELRDKIVCVEDSRFTKDYHDPAKRSIANGLAVEFMDGSKLDEVVVEYPVGHSFRRSEGIPLLHQKFRLHLSRHFSSKRQSDIMDIFLDQTRLEAMPVNEFLDKFAM